jgi:hypothetical protein
MTKVTFKTPEGVPVEIDSKKVDRVAEGINDQSTRIYTDSMDVTVLGTLPDVSVKLGLADEAPEADVADYTADANKDETVKLMPNTAPVNDTPAATADEEGKAKADADEKKAADAKAADAKKADAKVATDAKAK